MELTWTTEKNEKETINLFLRRRGFLRELHSVMVIGFLFVGLLVVSSGSYAFLLLIFCLGYIGLDWMLIYVPKRFYRRRVTNRVEYRLTDDALAFTVGEASYSSPWSKVAKKFRIDKKALYLYGKDLPFEAQCIPDWQGHGVERKELIATLKKAGLKKAMSGRLKFFIGLIATPVVLAVLLTIYFYIGGIEWGDWTIPDEAELRLEPRDVPDEDNAYLALQALTNLYHVAEGDDKSTEISDKTFVSYYGNPFFTDGDNDEREKWAATRSDPSSPERAARILAANAKFFEAFRMALLRKDFKAPETIIPSGNPCVSNLPELKPIIEFARLIRLKAQIEFEKGNVTVAINDVRNIHFLGQMLAAKTDARSSGLVQFMVGELLKKFACGKMCDFIVMGKATDEMLDKFFKMVDEDDAVAPANRARALKARWDAHFRFVDWFCDKVYSSTATPIECYRSLIIDAERAAGTNEESHEQERQRSYNLGSLLWSWPGVKGFTLHRREMKFHVAEILRATLAKKDLEDTLDKILPTNPIRKFVTLLLPNACGKVIVVGLAPFFEPLFIAPNLSCQRIRLILAAEKWRRAHGGKNPPTLDALVPDYIAAVPRDPWSKSGEPIKYDAASGVAWSVGKDGKYDYQKIVKGRAATGNNSKEDDDTQDYASHIYAFRLDGKPIRSLAEPLDTNAQP